jgi:hypothetical protein
MLVDARADDVCGHANPSPSMLAVAAGRQRGAARRRTENPATHRGAVQVGVFDRFLVGSDVDAISRASISVKSGTRAVRDSVRVAARAFLNPEQVQRPAR